MTLTRPVLRRHLSGMASIFCTTLLASLVPNRRRATGLVLILAVSDWRKSFTDGFCFLGVPCGFFWLDPAAQGFSAAWHCIGVATVEASPTQWVLAGVVTDVGVSSTVISCVDLVMSSTWSSLSSVSDRVKSSTRTCMVNHFDKSFNWRKLQTVVDTQQTVHQTRST